MTPLRIDRDPPIHFPQWSSATTRPAPAHAREIASPPPGVPASTLSSRYAPAWYTKTQVLDVLDRPLTATTGLPGNITQLLGSGSTSAVAFTYARTGRVKTIAGSYGTLFAGGVYGIQCGVYRGVADCVNGHRPPRGTRTPR